MMCESVNRCESEQCIIKLSGNFQIHRITRLVRASPHNGLFSCSSTISRHSTSTRGRLVNDFYFNYFMQRGHSFWFLPKVFLLLTYISFFRVMGTIAVMLPTIVIPVRVALGLPVNQYTRKLMTDLTPAQIYLAKKAASQESSWKSAVLFNYFYLSIYMLRLRGQMLKSSNT